MVPKLFIASSRSEPTRQATAEVTTPLIPGSGRSPRPDSTCCGLLPNPFKSRRFESSARAARPHTSPQAPGPAKPIPIQPPSKNTKRYLDSVERLHATTGGVPGASRGRFVPVQDYGSIHSSQLSYLAGYAGTGQQHQQQQHAPINIGAGRVQPGASHLAGLITREVAARRNHLNVASSPLRADQGLKIPVVSRSASKSGSSGERTRLSLYGGDASS